MAKKIDLRVKMGPVTYKNPLLEGSSEIVCDEKTARRALEHGAGGIVTKTFTCVPEMQTRPSPYHAHYRKFGLKDSWITFVRLDTVPWDKAAKTVIPKIKKVCDEYKVPLVGSVGGTTKPDDWAEMAQAFEKAGCDTIEFNFSCPQTEFCRQEIPIGKTVGEDKELVKKILQAAKRKVKVPIRTKLGPLHEPPAYYAKTWIDAGADQIAAHNAPIGMMIDLDKEEPFCAPYVCGYLPGRAYLPMSIGRIVEIRKAVPKALISGIGGIFEPQDVLQYLLVGCPTVQVCSGVYNKGYGIYKKLLKGIEDWMESKGYRSIEEFLGKALEKVGDPPPKSHPIPFHGIKNQLLVKRIKPDDCTYCGKCTVCIYEAIEVDGKTQKFKIHPNECWGCGFCVGLCPEEVLGLVDRKTGKVKWANSGTAENLRPVKTSVVK